MTGTLEYQFASSPELFPHILDVMTDQVLLSRLTEGDYKQASFLDQRLITEHLPRQMVTWQKLQSLNIPDLRKPNFIFHIGHVGSTLLSRLLGEAPDSFALREPCILRTFAEMFAIKHLAHSPWSPQTFDDRLGLYVKWLSRTFYSDQKVIIKASSFVSELAKDILSHSNKALFLFVKLQKYLETIMAGEGSRKEAEHLASTRLARLNDHVGEDVAHLWKLSHIQKVALGWLCEMTTLYSVAQSCQKDKILWQNFDSFLEYSAHELEYISEFFGLKFLRPSIEEVLSGPIMSTYSKAPEHGYSASLRKHLLNQARQEFSLDMKQATQWVIDLGQKHPLIGQVIAFSENK